MKIKNKAEFEFPSTTETISVEQMTITDDGRDKFEVIKLTLNAWADCTGGSDGEEIVMTLPEFQEFIDACQRVLDEAKEN